MKCIENLFFNDYIKTDEIIRHDYKTKAYLLIIEKEKLNFQHKFQKLFKCSKKIFNKYYFI